MARSKKYVPQPPPSANIRLHLNNEQLKIAASIESVVAILEALNVPVEIGPADSAGAGFRALRIPN